MNKIIIIISILIFFIIFIFIFFSIIAIILIYELNTDEIICQKEEKIIKKCKKIKPKLPIIPDLTGVFGLPGINYPYQNINTNGEYYLFALNENNLPISANIKNQYDGMYSRWTLINNMDKCYKLSMYYLVDDDDKLLPFFENINTSINWTNAQYNKSLPIYPNMRIKLVIENDSFIRTEWFSSPSWNDIYLILNKNGTLNIYNKIGC